MRWRPELRGKDGTALEERLGRVMITNDTHAKLRFALLRKEPRNEGWDMHPMRASRTSETYSPFGATFYRPRSRTARSATWSARTPRSSTQQPARPYEPRAPQHRNCIT